MEDFSNKCFVIMPISDKEGYPIGHFTKVYEQIFKPAIKESGFEPYRVDEDRLSSSIVQKIYDGLSKAPMAICDLSSANPNVLYELGIRHSFDLPVVLVKDEKTDFIFDVSTINTVTYQSDRVYENVISAIEDIKKSIKHTQTNAEKGTVLSILNVQKAIVDDKNVNQEDKTELMFSKILLELQQLKDDSLFEHNRYSSAKAYERLISNEKINLNNVLENFPTLHEYMEKNKPYNDNQKKMLEDLYFKLVYDKYNSKQ